MSEDPETALVQELRALAEPHGKGDGRFTVRRGTFLIMVTYTSGSSSSLRLETMYDRVSRDDHPALIERTEPGTYRDGKRKLLSAPRPLAIELRNEMPADKMAKAEGLSVEWQSGDAEFDRDVYVSTPTSDPGVLAAVLGPEVRRAARDLLRLGFSNVKIDADGEVSTYLSEFAIPSKATRARRGEEAIDAFARILSNLPVIAASGEAPARAPLAGWSLLLRVIGIGGWALNVGYVGILIGGLKTLNPRARDPGTALVLLAIAIGLVGGFLGAKIYGGIMRARVQGTSLAHGRVMGAQWTGFGAGSVLTFTAVVIAIVLGQAR